MLFRSYELAGAVNRFYHETRILTEENEARKAGYIGLIALACVAGLVTLSLHRQSGAMVQITQDGQVVGTYSLQQPRTLRYESQDGGYNIVVIADGKVRVSEASCPDQVCVRTGPTDQTASPIACLPNRLVIQVIDNGTSSQLDGVS